MFQHCFSSTIWELLGGIAVANRTLSRPRLEGVRKAWISPIPRVLVDSWSKNLDPVDGMPSEPLECYPRLPRVMTKIYRSAPFAKGKLCRISRATDHAWWGRIFMSPPCGVDVGASMPVHKTSGASSGVDPPGKHKRLHGGARCHGTRVLSRRVVDKHGWNGTHPRRGVKSAPALEKKKRTRTIRYHHNPTSPCQRRASADRKPVGSCRNHGRWLT